MTAEQVDERGPGLSFKGMVIIEWPAPKHPGQLVPLQGCLISVYDAISGRQITTVTGFELHATAGGMVTADLTLFTGKDGQPLLDGKPRLGPEHEPITATFPFLVAEMRVRQ